MLKTIIKKIAEMLGLTIQDTTASPMVSNDYYDKGMDTSYVSMVCEAVTSLMCMFFTMPVIGSSQRALWLDKVSRKFVNERLDKALQSALATGSSITVPIWDGNRMKNFIIDANGYEPTDRGIIHYVDSFKKDRKEYTLLQSITLEPYTSQSGQQLQASVLHLYVVESSGGKSYKAAPLNVNPEWAGYAEKVTFYDVDRPMYAMMMSLATDPNNLNTEKGVPLTFGAARFIKEQHFLDDQQHVEVELSEKFVGANPKLFRRSKVGGKAGEQSLELPEGQQRVFRMLNMESAPGENSFLYDWSPEMRIGDFLEAREDNIKMIEAASGLSDGILSNVDMANYQNIDHIRKANIKTQSTIDKYRKATEEYLSDLVYCWNIIANTYNITPTGIYEVDFDWSDQYVTSFSQMTESILAGESIGATDRYDYRQQLFDEPPEVIKRRLDEIRGEPITEIEV